MTESPTHADEPGPLLQAVDKDEQIRNLQALLAASEQKRHAVLPHSWQHEANVIATFLSYPEALDDYAFLTPEHFHDRINRQLFKRIREAWSERGAVDTLDRITIAQRVAKDLGPEVAGDLTTLLDGEPEIDHIETHAVLLREFKAARMALAMCRDVERTVYGPGGGAALLAVTGESVTKIHDEITGSKPAITLESVQAEIGKDMEDKIKGLKTAMGFSTGLPELDRRFNGLHRGQLVVISGYPGGGKSVLLGQLAAAVAKAGQPAFICSLEMTEKQFVERLSALLAGLPGIAVTDPLRYVREYYKDKETVTKSDLIKIDRAFRILRESKFFVERLNVANIQQVSASIRRRHRVTPLALAVVDFAQQIQPLPGHGNETQERTLALAAGTLGRLAGELDICILLGSQLNKEGEAKGATAINESAHLHLRIKQSKKARDGDESERQKHLGLVVDKDRLHGNQGELIKSIVLDAPFVRFIEEDPNAKEPPSSDWVRNRGDFD